MKLTHGLENGLVGALLAGARAVSWRTSLDAGAALGDLVRTLGLRRRVAEENLARAFPERSLTERAALLSAHYRELGRVCVEYARLPELVHAQGNEVIATVRGLERLDAARARGRGAILLTGHYGNFELLGAWLGRIHPIDFLVQEQSNPAVHARASALRTRAGVGQIPLGAGVRGVFGALRRNRWIFMIADQDARQRGVFVPFFGIPTSTPVGPAEFALRTGAALLMCFITRRPDGRHEIDLEGPLEAADSRAENAVLALTAAHTARLENRIRERPEMWFWLHRRWKTPPP